ncbi:MAG: hypothetical protein ACTIJN_03725 [Microbacterium gubbeenense]|uniref:hypothetical protein n=1 Tax=Microbacterium gubbeenense TaxID=159896 RepID=UPI003F99CB40
MATRIGVAVMALAFALYIWLLGGLAISFIRVGIDKGEPVALIMGIALVIFPFIGAWALGRELWFGWRGEQLAKRLGAEGLLPDEEVELRPSGRVLQSDADALFPTYKSAVEDAPEDWRAWFRLGVVYDAAGDRKRARSATREAIRLERQAIS